MARCDYIALAWRRDDPSAAAAAERLCRRLDFVEGWRRVADTPQSALFLSGEMEVRALADGAGFLIGQLEARAAVGAINLRIGAGGAAAWARRLSQEHWGAYVALLHDPGASEEVAVFRDPSGGLGLLHWRLPGEVVVVSSDLRPVPGWLRPVRLALDWSRITAFVASPAIGVGAPLFADLALTGPGDLQRLGPRLESLPVWRPHAFAADGAGPRRHHEAAEILRAAVDAGVAGSTAGYSDLLLDVSGGLDSAILAGALARTGRLGRVAELINRYGDRPEGDERVYARAVAARHGRHLTELPKSLAPLREKDLAALADCTWPAVNAMDAARDADMAARLAGFVRGAALSGQGGDAVFFQMPTALVAADAWAQEGWRALASGLVADIARRTHTSAWDVLRQARRDRRRVPQVAPLSAMLTDVARERVAGATHAWVAESRDLSPARRLQIGAIVNAQVYRQDCRRGRAGDLVYPLLTQPVIEAALSIPTPLLAGAAYDRPFARAVFADYVPEIVRRRRSKGSLTAHYARWVAASLPLLRPYLLDGCLAEAGVLDRGRLDRALDPQSLIWAPQAGDLVNAAAVEAWVRYWQGRAPDVGAR